MLTRRSVLKGLVCACACCSAADVHAARFSGALCATASGEDLDAGTILRSSGDAVLDKGLIAELNLLSGYFGYRPAFLLYTGGEKNASAVPQTLQEFAGTTGIILYNLEMLNGQLSSSKLGGLIVAGVLAHEFAHIYQNYSGNLARLKSLDRTVRFIELHADFLSGFYMRGKQDAGLAANDYKDYADAFFGLGDYEFTKPHHHGTPQERYFALKAGLNLRARRPSWSVADAAREGEGFLKEYIH